MPTNDAILTRLAKAGLKPLAAAAPTGTAAAALSAEGDATSASGPLPLWLVQTVDGWYLEHKSERATQLQAAGASVQALTPDEAFFHRDGVQLDVETAYDGMASQPTQGLRGVTGGQLVLLDPSLFTAPPSPEQLLANQLDAPPDGVRTNRVLLLIHGTFANSDGLVTAFTPDMHANFARNYRAVLAFTHHTRSVTPEVNARLLDSQLAPLMAAWQSVPDWGAAPEIHIISHSRGGLVARSFTELVRPAYIEQVKKVVMVATPNAGTNLAVPENVGQVVGHLTKLAGDMVADLVQNLLIMLGNDGEQAWSGVGCMEPNGPWLTTNLYATAKPDTATYYTVSGNYDPTFWHPVQKAESLLFHNLFLVPNDCAVDTEAPTGRTVVVRENNAPAGRFLDLEQLLLIDGGGDAMADLIGTLRNQYKDRVLVAPVTGGCEHRHYFRLPVFEAFIRQNLVLG